MRGSQMSFPCPPPARTHTIGPSRAAALHLKAALVAPANEPAHVFLRAEVQSCGKTCEADGNHQWLGVSLSRQPGDNGGHVLVTNASAPLKCVLLAPTNRETLGALSMHSAQLDGGSVQNCHVFFSSPKSPCVIVT